MEPREKWIFLANLKFFVKYVIFMLFSVTFVSLVCWDPIFWGLLFATLFVVYLKYKIWG